MFSIAFQDVRRNPIGAENDVGNSDSNTPSPEPHEAAPVSSKSTKVDKNEARVAYHTSLEDVLGIWPDYQELRELKFGKGQLQLQTTLQHVYKTLVEQHISLGRASRENADLRQKLNTCRNDRDALNDIIKVKEREISDCCNDIGILRGELKRRGFDPKIPGRGYSESRQGQTAEADVRRHNRVPSDISESDEDPSKDKIKQKMKQFGQVQPTPLLVAEGSREGVENALKRRHSFKTAQQNSFDRDRDYRGSFRSAAADGRDRLRSDEENRLIDQLNERIRRLQDSLDKEKRTNETLLKRYEISIFTD